MSEMVDRVAKALSDQMEADMPSFTVMSWDKCTDQAREVFRKRARAAIEAMREPTERMSDCISSYDNPTIWQAMIDEALK